MKTVNFDTCGMLLYQTYEPKCLVDVTSLFVFPRCCISLRVCERAMQVSISYHRQRHKGKQIAFLQIGAVLDDKQAVRWCQALICQTCSEIKNALAFRTDKSSRVICLQVSATNTMANCTVFIAYNKAKEIQLQPAAFLSSHSFIHSFIYTTEG